MMRGIIGKKVGMNQVFKDDGIVEAVTIIEAGPCFVTQIKSVARDGYDAVQLGFGDAKRLNSPKRGHLKRLGLLKYLREFRVDNIDDMSVGQKIDVGIFQPGDIVDITGTSKGKGFAGVVKRYHFAGGPKTHGQSDRHRAPGSIGATTSPGRVFKGKCMAGHMGSRRVSVRHLRVVDIDTARNLILVRGTAPGAKNGLLLIKSSSAG
jgi:large subunit ribosomal protein L3